MAVMTCCCGLYTRMHTQTDTGMQGYRALGGCQATVNVQLTFCHAIKTIASLDNS